MVQPEWPAPWVDQQPWISAQRLHRLTDNLTDGTVSRFRSGRLLMLRDVAHSQVDQKTTTSTQDDHHAPNALTLPPGVLQRKLALRLQRRNASLQLRANA